MRQVRMSRRKRRAAGISVAMAVISLLSLSTPASAWVDLGPGCRYDPVNDDDGLGIGFGSNQNASMVSMTQDAAARWNYSMVPQFNVVSYGSSMRDLKVNFSTTLPYWVGAQTTSFCGGDHYTQDPDFLWNKSQGYYTGTNQRWSAIATHEIGHSYGLYHNNTVGCNTTTAGLMHENAVAKTDSCGWWGPTADDATGATYTHNNP
jgi:hypothetical protein